MPKEHLASNSSPLLSFPSNFVWGASTSSYQIEGAWDQDGKGPSVWDVFTKQPGRIYEGNHGDVACDHYHRYKDDVELMREIGLKAYRFSISWPRVLPQGTGSPNPAGLDFYDRLVDVLLTKNIVPWVTLFHWDYPYALFLRGGWLNPESPKWFERYTALVVDRLSDRVSHWMTVNEPQCFVDLGLMRGDHAPGLRMNLQEGLLAAHNTLLAHGRSVQVIRARAKRKPTIGWSPAGFNCYPATETTENIEAARRATLAVFAGHAWNNRWWGDAAILGRYPEEGLKVYGSAVPHYKSSDFDIISQPIDFYGCNLYSGVSTVAGPDGQAVHPPMPAGFPQTLALWKKTPECFYWGSRFLSEHYHLPIVVTESGMSNCDWISIDGRCHDPARIDFMNSYLLQLRRAIFDGVDVRGYFAWSLMDNFEWNDGYKHRYGLIYIDYETQQRTLKDSALWYRDVIASNGSNLEDLPSSTTEQMPYIVKGTIRYVHTHVGTPFLVKDIATHLHCHPDFLSRKFKQHVGVDLGHYIRKTRIEHAKELLKNQGTRIGEAAERSGFVDPVNFSKVFRRTTGRTPSQFKQQFCKKSDGTSPISIKPENPRSPRGAHWPPP
jgi:beta-glucosidase